MKKNICSSCLSLYYSLGFSVLYDWTQYIILMQYTLFHFLMTKLRLKVKVLFQWCQRSYTKQVSKWKETLVFWGLFPQAFFTVKQLECLLEGNNLPLFLSTYLSIFWIYAYVPDTVFCLSAFYFVLEWGFPGGSDGKESACNAVDPGSIPGLGRTPGEGIGNPLQYSCLQKNPTDRGRAIAWRAIVQGVAKRWTGLSE